MSRDKQIEEMAKVIASVPPLEFAVGGRCQGKHIYTLNKFAETLYEAGYRKQSEDTVEVVRCKDCKHYKPQTLSKRWENKTKYCCRGTTVKVKDNDFCSYGEPKMKGGGE